MDQLELPWPRFVEVTNTSQLYGPPETRIRISGKIKTLGDYAGLTCGGTPILVVMATLGRSIEIEEVPND